MENKVPDSSAFSRMLKSIESEDDVKMAHSWFRHLKTKILNKDGILVKSSTMFNAVLLGHILGKSSKGEPIQFNYSKSSGILRISEYRLRSSMKALVALGIVSIDGNGRTGYTVTPNIEAIKLITYEID